MEENVAELTAKLATLEKGVAILAEIETAQGEEEEMQNDLKKIKAQLSKVREEKNALAREQKDLSAKLEAIKVEEFKAFKVEQKKLNAQQIRVAKLEEKFGHVGKAKSYSQLREGLKFNREAKRKIENEIETNQADRSALDQDQRNLTRGREVNFPTIK